MMKKKLISGTMAIVALALLISAAAGVWSLDRQETSAARQSLVELLDLIDAGEVPPARALEAFRAAIPDKRLTLIAPDGTVLADTGSDTTENHLERPEVQEALAVGWGEDVRTSTTLGTPMLYVAKQLSDGAVGRAAMPLSFIDAFVLDGLPPLILAALAALALAFALSGRMARTRVGPLAAVDLSLREALSGNRSAVDLRQYDAGEELRPLLRSIGALTERLTDQRDQLQRERAELKRAENIRSEFTANVSHELKTPLTSIKGFVEMLSQDIVKEEDRKSFYTMIGVETDRLISLINDILKLSELESAAIPEPSETASPLEAAREAARLLSAEAGQKNIAILARGEAGEAKISGERLKELLLNLMENAVRYGKEGGGVEVTVAREGETMTVSVADDGIGISAEAQPHVFERFYRVDKGRSRQNGGTGLGLAIVKHICQLYGGSVALKSAPGEGSVFTVTLPAAE